MFRSFYIRVGSHGRTIFLLKAKAKESKLNRKKTIHKMLKPKLPHEPALVFGDKGSKEHKQAEMNVSKQMEGLTKPGQ